MLIMLIIVIMLNVTYKPFVLIVVMQSVVRLNVVAPLKFNLLYINIRCQCHQTFLLTTAAVELII